MGMVKNGSAQKIVTKPSPGSTPFNKAFNEEHNQSVQAFMNPLVNQYQYMVKRCQLV